MPVPARKNTYGNTAQFPPYGLSTAPAAAARHLRCQNARLDIQYYLRFWLSICRTSLAVSALRIMRYCLIRWESRKKQKNGLFLQRGGLFEFPVSPKWMYNRKESL